MSTDLDVYEGGGEAALPLALLEPHLPAGLVPTAPRVGKIGAGEKDPERGFPKRAEAFVFTHPDPEMAAAVHAAYGGPEPFEYTDAKMNPPRQHRVRSAATSIDVLVATSGAFEFVYESWTEGGVSMRTDGWVNLITGERLADPCPNDEQGAKEWIKRHGLKLTTRVQVIPLDLPSLTPWRVETHGWIASRTFADAARKLAVFGANGLDQVPCRLTLTPGTGNEVVKPGTKGKGVRQMADGTTVRKSNFVIWGLEILTKTPREMIAFSQAASSRVAELEAHTEQKALEASTRRLHVKRTVNPDDPFDLEGANAEPPALSDTVPVSGVKTAVVAVFREAGDTAAAAKDKAAHLWADRGLPSGRGATMPRADADALVAGLRAELAAAPAPVADDDVADGEIVEDDDPFALGGES